MTKFTCFALSIESVQSAFNAVCLNRVAGSHWLGLCYPTQRQPRTLTKDKKGPHSDNHLNTSCNVLKKVDYNL